MKDPIQLEQVRALLAEGAGDRKIASKLAVTRHQARNLIHTVEIAAGASIVDTAHSFYDVACRALAKAKTLDEVMDIENKAAAFQEYMRRAKDRNAELDAMELRLSAERRLGEMMKDLKVGGHLKSASGRRKKNPTAAEVFILPSTLGEMGISYGLAARAQDLAEVPEGSFQARKAAWRANAENDPDKIAIGILRNEVTKGARASMASRDEPADSLDFFPTPPWCTRALMDRVFPYLDMHAPFGTAWEPACGEGHISEVLKEYFAEVRATDIHNYTGNELGNFPSDFPEQIEADWIITNPPFGEKATEFILGALNRAGIGIAMFLQLRYLEGLDRYRRVYEKHPPTACCFWAERVPLHRNRWEWDGDTATAYCWLVWVHGASPRPPFWIPPGCREACSRDDDPARFNGVSKKDRKDD